MDRYDPLYCEIQRYRLNMIFHSQAYYTYSITFLSDAKFDEMARELVKLQAEYPDASKEVPYAKEFEDWDGTTGFHLCTIDEGKFLGKIYRACLYRRDHLPNEFTSEMADLIDNIQRGIV